ncbi:MAG TPA: DoxX family protein [Steroidobacteraceae bacterium]|nr:DoxX family protein [Steroidobacteraceae bacterium]
MNRLLDLTALHAALGRALDHLRTPVLLATRYYVGWQFWKSGLLKVTSWSSTLELFRSEYHVPVLPPEIAAVTGAGGELFFPVLLFLGLFSRVGALGAFFVNAMAVISYRQVLLAEGSEAALGQHILWGFMLLVLAVFGPGRMALDTWLENRNARRCRPFSPALPA